MSMAMEPYLAMTAGEIRGASVLPRRTGWLSCHFSPSGVGLSNLPVALPPGSLLILDDSTPMDGHDPEQIAGQLGIPREEVVFAMDAMADPVSLYEPLYDSGGDALCVMDQIGDDSSSDTCWLQQLALKDAIARLTPRQRDILALRYSEGKTQMEVSREIGISQAQVSRLEKGAIGEIKKNL